MRWIRLYDVIKGCYMKRLKLLLYAVSPFVIGYLIDRAMWSFGWFGSTISAINILFAAYWFFVGYLSYDYTKTFRESILLGNSFAIVSLFSVVVQLMVLGRYVFGIVGIAPQMFYLPIIWLSSSLERVIFPFIRTQHTMTTLIWSFLLMLGLYYAGYSVRLRNVHKS